ncbi:polymorphic outer membrane protein middle domain-containing protein [Chlamydia pecorum]|uniref:Outer membrane protein 5 n=1 Tax=Chlamydia pecorum (strain ATCC VR-628 / DSM 29919 / E58) TaxID=331635 RepID=A0AA34RD99_CHLPE|nr:polymorphic outer membrane protein middle domain-containing protein [Chlamydia pecorum]AEB41582.1 outer membrane protein 5 [Chlamydia pecorum E58]UFP07125.1 autotransporter domain-containing protein [Chlamydia pecorum]UJT76954.1 polymorphic outer membrane protein [Chlamydia pecorum]
MKCSLHRLLVSSAIALPFSSFSLFSAETPLGSADSYSGSGNTVQFTPKATNDSAGTTYSCTGDMSIYNAGSSGSPLSSACFQEQAGDLTFDGNGYSMSFNTINVAASNPGAINAKGADKTLTLMDFSTLSFIASPSSTTGTGAIESAGTINLTNNNYVTFINNASTTTGGATCSQGNCTISGNQTVLFDSNKTSGSNINGGAICCFKQPPAVPPPAPILTIKDNNEVTFINNTASGSGGAIYAQSLTLSSEGKGVLFTNNTASATSSPKGGAIAIADNGEISLSADGGNITFNGNTTNTTGGAGTPTRNAIDLGSQAKFTVLRATEGNSIYFYDPITGDSAASSGDLNINNPESSATYGGSIVFSGEKLSETEKQQSSGANLKSTFKQPVTLKSGSLVLKDGVTVDTNTFTQESGSTLLMDAGTTLSASTASVTVTNLAVNMSSLNGTDKVTLSATASSQNVTLSGPITLMDDGGNAYENPDLRNSQDFSFVELSAGSTGGAGTATPPDSNNTNPQITEQTPQHYGYQGTWAVKWVPGTGAGGGTAPQTQTATLSWAKTGYIPNPQKRGNLVPNSLWGVFVDVRSIQEVMKRSSDSLNEGRGIWASAIGNFFHRDNINKGSEIQQGFRHRSAGYIIGASTPTIEDNVLNLAFCQLFGRDKDRLVTKNHITSYAGSINFQHEGRLDYITNLLPQGSYSAWGPIALMLNAQLTYCHSSNDMKTSYTQPTPQEVQSSWGNDGLGMEIGGLVSIPTQHFRWFSSYSPFVKVQLTYAHQEDFKESGEAARSFETSDLFNFGMPIGIKLEKSMGLSSYDLSIAYVPDIIRSNPDCTTTLIISGDSWQTFGTNLARNALLIRAGNYFTFSDTWEMFSQFAFELKSSSRSYSVDLGSKIRF